VELYSVWGAKGFGSGMLTSAKLVSFGNGVVEYEILLSILFRLVDEA
jgi:hypothetical protein